MDDRLTDPETLSVDDYARALLAIQPKITPRQFDMLRAHYRAPNHRLSAREMAKAVSLRTGASANLQYGILAGHLREILSSLPESDNVYLLATLIPPGQAANPEWLWELRPQVAEALERLGWL
jgi:hypothetical protein